MFTDGTPEGASEEASNGVGTVASSNEARNVAFVLMATVIVTIVVSFGQPDLRLVVESRHSTPCWNAAFVGLAGFRRFQSLLRPQLLSVIHIGCRIHHGSFRVCK